MAAGSFSGVLVPFASRASAIFLFASLAGCASHAGEHPAKSVQPAPPLLVGESPPQSTAYIATEPAEPLVVEHAAFGRVEHMDVRTPFWGNGRTLPAVGLLPQRYERWHEKRHANVGYGYLSVVDLSVDDRFVLVASEDEAKLRLYDFEKLRVLAAVPVAGYEHFGAGDFVFDASTGTPPTALFAGATGISAVDTRTGQTALLSAEPAGALRWSDDRTVLGAASAQIPAQRSRLVFYRYSPPATLDVLAILDFSERVEEWDLDSEKRRLAVTYYPSNETEFLDLSARAVLWVAKAPEYANSVDISPDDSKVAVGGASVVVHDARSGTVLASDAHFGNNIHRVRFSPRGDALAVSSYEGKLRLFDTTAAGPELPLRKLLRHSGTANVYALSFTRDGSALVSGSGDKTVRVWAE